MAQRLLSEAELLRALNAEAEGASAPQKKTGYYARPEFGKESEGLYQTAKTSEAELSGKKTAFQQAQRKRREAEECLALMTQQAQLLQENYQRSGTEYSKKLMQDARSMLEQQLISFADIQGGYDKAYADYDSAYRNYTQAVSRYNSYLDSQRAQFEAWKGTIRDGGTVQGELDAIDAQISKLKKEDKLSELNAFAGKLANSLANSLITTSSGLAPTTVQYPAAANDAKLRELEAARALLQEEYDWGQFYRYDDLRAAEDFAEKSKYASKANGKTRTPLEIMMGTYSEESSGWDDPLYEFINGNQEAGAFLSNMGASYYGPEGGAIGAAFGRVTEDENQSRQMSKDEVKIFNYLYATEGREAAHAYYSYLQSDLNARQREAEEKYWAEYAAENPVGSSVFSVATAPAKGMSYLGQTMDYLDDGKIDQNASYNKFSYAGGAIREQVSKDVEEKWGKAGSFAYQTGMSMADFLLNTAITGGNSALSMTIMGTGAAADATIEAKDRGLSDDQAFALGTIAGAAEAITEKISIDSLLGRTGMGKTAVGYILKNALAEGGEEAASTLINTMADILIAKDKSQWQLSIDAYVAEGKTEGEAFGLALRDQAVAMGLDALGGILSGGIMGGGGAIISDIDARVQGNAIGKQNPDITQMQAMIKEGLSNDSKTRSHYLAQQLQQKLARGEKLTNYDLGRLQQANAAVEEADRGVNEVPEDLFVNTQQTAEQADTANAGTLEEQAERLGKLVGREVVLYTADATEDGIENGYYKDGKLYINSKGTDPFVQTFSHELTHSVELADVYQELSEVVMGRIAGTGADIGQLRKQKAALYAQNGVTLKDRSEIDREIVADYVAQNLLSDEQSIAELTREKPNLGRRILNWLDGLLAKLGNRNAQERAFLSRARNLYAQALEQSQSSFTGETAKAPAQTQSAQTEEQTPDAEGMLDWARQQYANGLMTEEEFDSYVDQVLEAEDLENSAEPAEVKHSFAGPNAAGADLDALDRAKQMQAAGVADETIRQETGWHVGMDGKWRWEIDDSGMRYYRNGDALFSEMHPEYARHQELMKKVLYGELTALEESELRKLDEIWGSENQRLKDRVNRGNAQLQNLIQHSALFDAYPELRGTKVRFEDMPAGTRGRWDSENKIMTLSNELRGAPEDTLVHEIQHVIQTAEGFAGGASVEYWKQQRADIVETIAGARRNLDMWLDDIGYKEVQRESLLAASRREKTMEQHWKDMAEFKANSKYARQISACEAELAEFQRQYDEITHGMTAYEQYENTAGEIEARDAASRRQLTAEQRRSAEPARADDRTVFVEGVDEIALAEMDAEYGPQLQSYFDPDVSTEEIERNIANVAQMDPVVRISGEEFAKGEKDLITQVEEFFAQMGNSAHNQQLGDVILDRRGIKSDIAHGIGRKKAAAFAAVPDVISKGLIVDYQQNWKDRGYDTAVLAAPVTIGEEDHIAAVILTRSNQTNRFYVHEVLTMKNGATPFKTGAQKKGAPGGDAPSIFSILEKIRSVKNGTSIQESFSLDDAEDQEQQNQNAQAESEEESFEERYGLRLPGPEDTPADLYRGHSLSEDSEVYRYEFLTSQPDMHVVQLPGVDLVRDSDGKIDSSKIVEAGMKNALSVGTERAGKTYVTNRYTGNDLWVTAAAIRHGLNGTAKRKLTNARLGTVIGDIVQNAIPINALHNTADNVEGTYAMAGYATDENGREFVAIVTVEQRSGNVSGVDTYDITHAISGRQKRGSRADTKSQGVYPSTNASKGGSQADTKSQGVNLIKTSSEISIADLLASVKDVYQSILSEDVLSHFYETRNPEGHYTGRAKFSISPSPAQAEPEGMSLPTVEEDPGAQIRSKLPVKARDYLKRAESKLLNTIGNKLSVPWHARREFLQEIVEAISNEYLASGTISGETASKLFEKAYEQGVVMDQEFYAQYKDVGGYLRTTAVTIGTQDQSEIADYDDFKNKAKYTLRIASEGGMPVGEAYGKLREMAPDLFPDNLVRAADQLQQMLKVGYSIKTAERSIQKYHSENPDEAEQFRYWAHAGFNEAIDEAVVDSLRNVKRIADEQAEQEAKAQKVPMTIDEAMETYAQLKEARRNYEKVRAKTLLNEHDEALVGDLLRGKTTLENLDPETDNVKDITAVYEAKKPMEDISKQLAEYKQNLRKQARDKADQYLETANDWKDKKVGLAYSRETMRRNVQDIVPDKDVADAVNREYFEPVAVAEAAATRFKEQYRKRVKELGLSRKVEKGNIVSEAHAVQLLGESLDNIKVIENARGRLKTRDGKSLSDWRAVVDNLWMENPGLDRAKIEQGVEAFRKIYDELFQQMNRERVANGYEPVNYRKGYFPHFQPGQSDGILAHFGRIMGIDTSVVALPTTINGLTHTFKPGIQWFGNAQERLGFNTAYDALEGFDKYIEGVASVIHQTKNIQNLRALATQMRYRTSDEGIRKQVDAVQENPRLTEEEKQVQIAEIYSHGQYTLSNFVVELDEYTNILANKKSKLDRTVEGLFGRKFYTFMKWWESRVGANMIAGNLSSALTNFIPLTQAGAQLDSRSMLQGMWNTLKAIKADDGIVETSDFLTNRRGSDPLIKTWEQKASAVAGKPMELIDSFVSGSIVRAAYYQNLKQGISEAEALHQADIFAASVMADRSKGAMPTLFASTNPLFKAFTQFQLEVNNQFSEVFKDLPRGFKNKGLKVLAGVLFKYFIGAFLFNDLFEHLFGRRPALDPIGILNDTIGDLSGYELPNLLEMDEGFETERVGFGHATKNLAGNLLEELPFSSGLTLFGIETDGGRLPASSAVPDLTALWDAATTEGWSPKKRVKEAWDEISKPLTYIVPPFGGNQIAKTWKGLAAYFRGGSYNVDKDGNDILQYPVYKDDTGDAFWNLVRAMIMGKSSLPEAQNWVESGFDSLSAKQTAAYQDMVDAGVRDRDAYGLLMDLQGAAKTEEASKAEIQRQMIRDSGVSGEGKAIAYYGMVASEADRELMDKLVDLGAGTAETADVVMGLRDLSELKGMEKKQAQSKLISGSGMTDEEKSVVLESILGSELMSESGNPTQYAKFLCARETGLSIDGYLELYGAGVDLDDYFELTDAGMNPKEAKDLAVYVQSLKPADGKGKVTDLQKWRAAIDKTNSAKDQMTALSAVMSDDQYRKVEIANSFAVAPGEYVRMREELPKFDADGNGSFAQAELTAAVDSMPLSTQQKAALWQLAATTNSAKNNPYSVEIGEQVLAAKQAAAEKSEAEPENLSFSEEIMRQLLGRG